MSNSSNNNTASSANTTKTIVITGGLGNLGTKLSHHLLSTTSSSTTSSSQYKVYLIEHPNFITPKSTKHKHPDAKLLPCDLGNPTLEHATAIKQVLEEAECLIHFSAVNPYPNASWSESAQSMDHVFYIFQLAVLCKVQRVILASSNHVMGGYKDDQNYGPQSIYPSSDPRCGTIPLNKSLIATSGDAIAYSTAKLAGERCAINLAKLYGDTTTFLVLRIGWCQPGENKPSTLSAAGSPPEFLLEGDDNGNNAISNEQAENDKKDERWYKGMWLSNSDFLNYFESAMHVNVPTTEEDGEGGVHRNVRKGYLLVNAMSKNEGAKWNLEETEKWLGVVSTDNSMA